MPRFIFHKYAALPNQKLQCQRIILKVKAPVKHRSSHYQLQKQTLYSRGLNIQNKIYNLMSAKGWYQTTPAEKTEIAQAKQKYCSGC